MKFAFSNIAWTPHDDAETFALLRKHDIKGIEIAPTKIWPRWEGATPEAALLYAAYLKREGFEVAALQAVLFAKPDARLFDNQGEQSLHQHLSKVADLAEAFGARAVVLGAPGQRDRGSLTMHEAVDRAAEVFSRLAEVFHARNSCLCIEPNPRRYMCNFVINAAEAVTLVKRVNHPGFALHLDSAAMFLEGDVLESIWSEVKTWIRHFHISEPDLGDFRNAVVPHAENLGFLQEAGYEKWCSVEMREPKASLAVSGPWLQLDSVREGVVYE